jgi:hypothetical protein
MEIAFIHSAADSRSVLGFFLQAASGLRPTLSLGKVKREVLEKFMGKFVNSWDTLNKGKLKPGL